MLPLSESKAWTYALLNVAATPGLGSLLGRRFVAGALQLGVACAGFFCFLGWFIQKMRLFYGQIAGTTMPIEAGDQLGKWGVTLFMVAWAWSAITSVQMIIVAKKTAPRLPIPPRIQLGSPGQTNQFSRMTK